ncbi:MAG: S8 family serine peptidase [Solirubrobacteraceae bacterium]|nr:S8 family serine peptidase [Solirubrobacteraceae bacterium]
MATGNGNSVCPDGACPTRPGGVDDLQPDLKGTAPGLTALLLNSPSTPWDTTVIPSFWALGFDQQTTQGTLPGVSVPARIVSDSTGGSDLSGFSAAMASSFGMLWVKSAGNSGPAPSSMSCGVHNGLCVGAASPKITLDDTSDDEVTDYSSRGPTSEGWRKPDIVAVGDAYTACWNFAVDGGCMTGFGYWWRRSGTSYSAPQVAGGAALLYGAGITDPLAIRALLLNSARQGRAIDPDAPDGLLPMGTQTGWQPDWGWGMLDLTQAWNERTHLRSATVAPGTPRFFAATTTASQDRATLVWNERIDRTPVLTPVRSAGDRFKDTVVHPISALSLRERSAATCGVRATSDDGPDNVKQVRSAVGPAAVVYAVRADSPIDGLSAEPFVLASTRPTVELTAPVPDIELSADRDTLTTTTGLATLTARASNPSGDLDGAGGLSVELDLPPGLELVAGSPTQGSPTFEAGAERTFSWTVRATGEGSQPVRIAARTSGCGEPVHSSASATLTADLSGPVSQIALAVTGGTTVPVSWSAHDPSGVSAYRLERQTDGGAWADWLMDTQQTAAVISGEPGRTYRFRVRARDAHGQWGMWTTSPAVSIAKQRPPAPPERVLLDASRPRLTVRATTSIRRNPKTGRRTRVLSERAYLSGMVSAGASHRPTLAITLTGPRRLRVVRSLRLSPSRTGNWRASIALTRAASSFTRATLVLTYPGDERYTPSHHTFRLKRPR